MSRIYRRAAKVLLVDQHRRVLLFRGIDRTLPALAPWWFAAGGAVEAGEEPADAAVRELYEETGLRISDPGPVIMTRRFEWEFEGRTYDQEESYFLVRTTEFAPVTAGWSETERATMKGHKWWSIEDLRATNETVYPAALADLLEDLLAG
ncbi:MAG TPA: NUDIX domain-containing protein [Acidimicrobiia bacterium]|nr:NUDIX domain-containing protein [Acidimicrobiia bacterium]